MGIHGVRQLLHSNTRYRKKNTNFSLFRAVNGGLETRSTYKAQKYGRHLEMVRSELVFCVSARKLFLFSFSTTSDFRAATHSERR